LIEKKSEFQLKMDPTGLEEADEILSVNLKSLENELCNMLETESKLT
jgi:hypothetical protein